MPSAGMISENVGGFTTVVTGTFTRPGDTTAYAANDAVNNSTSSPAAISIAGAARTAAGSGVVLNARLVKSTTGTASSGFRLWLYISTPSSIPNDNAALQISAANKAARLGYIDMVAQVNGSDCVEYYGTPIFPGGLAFDLGSGTTLYALLQSLGSYTPGNAEVFDVYLGVLPD